MMANGKISNLKEKELKNPQMELLLEDFTLTEKGKDKAYKNGKMVHFIKVNLLMTKNMDTVFIS